MRTRKRLLLVGMIVFSVIAITSRNATPQIRNDFNVRQSEPSLSETVEWLKGKADEVVGIYPLWVTSGNTVESVGQRSLTGGGKLVADISTNCSFAWRVIEVKEATSVGLSTQQNSKTKKDSKSSIDFPRIIVIPPKGFEATSVSFPASDINPENIVVVKAQPVGGMVPRFNHAQFGWWIKLYTTDKKKSVRWHSMSGDQESNGFAIAFRTEEMARRFAKALKHSVELCGGKADKKEPF